MKYLQMAFLLSMLAVGLLLAGCSQGKVAPERPVAAQSTIVANEQKQLQSDPNMNPTAKAMLEADMARRGGGNKLGGTGFKLIKK